MSETAGTIIVLNDTYEEIIDSESGKIHFSKSPLSDNLDIYDLIIIFSNAIPYGDKMHEEIKRREREISNATAKGRQICILVYGRNDDLFKTILARLGLRFAKGMNLKHELRISGSEFKEHLSTYGGANGIFFGSNFIPVCSISEIDIMGHDFFKLDEADRRTLVPGETSEKDLFHVAGIVRNFKGNFVAGLSKKHGQSLITFLPFFITHSQYHNSVEFHTSIRKLIPALLIHRANTSSVAPPWIDTVKLGDQEKIEANLQRLREEIVSEQSRLDRLSAQKSILWLKHNELRDSVMDFLNDMQIATLKEDIGEEDFWILKNVDKIAMVEVKGKEHEISRNDLYALDTHRNERKKPDTFPAILIVNTHNKATSIKEKDRPISNEEVERAVDLNILIIRTIDLIRLYNLIKISKIASSDFLKTIETEHGWLNVTDKMEVIKKKIGREHSKK